MKFLAPALILFVLGLTDVASAQSRDHAFGLGLHVGDPNGFVGKYWFDADNALQVTLGWQRSWYDRAYYYNRPGVLLAVEWTNQFVKFAPRRSDIVRFGVHAGAGGALAVVADGDYCYYDQALRRTRCYDDGLSRLGFYLRAPTGFSAYFPKVRIEAYVEIVPSILMNDFRFRLLGGLGGRYYF